MKKPSSPIEVLMLAFFYKGDEAMSKIFSSFLNTLSLSLLITSCISAPPTKKGITPPETSGKETEDSRQLRATNERILMGTLSSKRDLYRDYRIGPEDLLEISVFEEEKLNKTVRVSSQGNISLPLVGILRVKDLTLNYLITP